jgi:hypothetical protein
VADYDGWVHVGCRRKPDVPGGWKASHRDGAQDLEGDQRVPTVQHRARRTLLVSLPTPPARSAAEATTGPVEAGRYRTQRLPDL